MQFCGGAFETEFKFDYERVFVLSFKGRLIM